MLGRIKSRVVRCNAETIWFCSRGSSAALKLFGFTLAEVPQRRNCLVLLSRKSRNAETIWFYSRGSSATSKLFGFTLAEVPQR